MKRCKVYFSVTFSWTSPLSDRKVRNKGALRDDRKNGCEADYSVLQKDLCKGRLSSDRKVPIEWPLTSLSSFCSSYLCRTASVPGFTLWIPSSSAMFPSRAAITRGEYRQLVSPLGSVIRCWRRSLAVMSCFIGRKEKDWFRVRTLPSSSAISGASKEKPCTCIKLQLLIYLKKDHRLDVVTQKISKLLHQYTFTTTLKGKFT